ncbi:MAG TPA: carboxypeptidase regulatory-like domain-containing protein [Candidatus Eisenbacteria bacterium]|nr:carboxypeptidase regulatory-like domain-containing protein [Candidatus Eisenbacteria bacterium]
MANWTGGRIALGLAAALLGLGAAAVEGAYREIEVTGGAKIAGQVRVTGEVTPLPPQPVFKEHDECGESVPDERLVIDSEHRLANAVVRLVDVGAGKPIARSEPVRLDNRKCTFVPHVVAAAVGQTLDIRNDDPFLHDAHAWLGTRTLFNLAVPKGRTVHSVLADPGIVHVNCNVRHTWMHAYLFVAENPYVAVTDASGGFTLGDVPPGTYKIAVWHELLGSQEREVTVAPGQAVTVDFALDAVAPMEPGPPRED